MNQLNPRIRFLWIGRAMAIAALLSGVTAGARQVSAGQTRMSFANVFESWQSNQKVRTRCSDDPDTDTFTGVNSVSHPPT